MPYISQKRVAITGAAGGFGRAMALHFASLGYKVAVADLNKEMGKATVEAIIGAGGDAFFQSCNVCEEADLQALLASCQQQWGGVDVLINNAGIASSAPIHKESMENWEKLFQVNTLGVVRGCKVFTPAFKAQGGGHIVNIASIAGISCTPMMAAYNSSKAAVIALSETLRWELKRYLIGVTVVCPSMFKTGIVEGSLTENNHAKASMQAVAEQSSISAEDIAVMVARAVERNQFMLLPHRSTHWLWWLKRLSPDFYQWFSAR
ncbi:short chain dehydrogenase [Oceanicoccus sagamiensis]|uniref:Short chain dehydrogenase n=2 Tax=Oceanicoccus sagamiensis TaxID=716816 RepID=A0A1X9NKU8_9GAMM|nr:short chain dehydrogenase [Oceanicoccus sagamiensis]